MTATTAPSHAPSTGRPPQAIPGPPPPARRRTPRRATAGVVRHAVLSVLGVAMLLPFVWMVLASFKDRAAIDSTDPVPTRWHAENYSVILGLTPDPNTGKYLPIAFRRWYFNSVFVAGWVTLLQVVTSAMAAFAFSRIRWRGREQVFLLYLATLMVPGVVTMIPNYHLMVKLHLVDSYCGLILPNAFGAFGTFLLRQFMLSIPLSLDEAAYIDGASHARCFWDVILPLSRPGLITLAIFTFLGNFNSFFWPLVLIKSEHLNTLPVGMLFFNGLYDKQTNLMMAATVMNLLPLIVLFVVCQKYLVKGIQLGAVKG
jgi:multiple sugar transport system permease protein